MQIWSSKSNRIGNSLRKNSGFSAMPRSILRVSIWKFNLVFVPHMQTNGKRALFFFFSRQVTVAFVFFRIVVSVISLKQNTKQKRACFPFVGWCMINTVSKNHIQIRSIERGVANLPLWQHLGWPSSYVYFVPPSLYFIFVCLFNTRYFALYTSHLWCSTAVRFCSSKTRNTRDRSIPRSLQRWVSNKSRSHSWRFYVYKNISSAQRRPHVVAWVTRSIWVAQNGLR